MDARGPKSHLDWLALVCMWIGAIVLAFRSASAPLMAGAPEFLAANFWNFVPAALLSIALIVYIYRLLWPIKAEVPVVTPAVVAPEKKVPSGPELAAMLSQSATAARNMMRIGRQERAAEKAWPDLKAAMLTVHKERGIPLVPVVKDPVANVEAVCRLFEHIGPLLSHGHDDEARAAAQKFVDYLNAADSA